MWSKAVNTESEYLNFKNKYIFLACFLILTKARLFKLCIDWFKGYLNTQYNGKATPSNSDMSSIYRNMNLSNSIINKDNI